MALFARVTPPTAQLRLMTSAFYLISALFISSAYVTQPSHAQGVRNMDIQTLNTMTAAKAQARLHMSQQLQRQQQQKTDHVTVRRRSLGQDCQVNIAANSTGTQLDAKHTHLNVIKRKKGTQQQVVILGDVITLCR